MVGTTRCWVLLTCQANRSMVGTTRCWVLLTCQAMRSMLGDHTLLGSADLSGHEVHVRGPHAAGFC